MASVASIKNEIKAIPNMTALYRDGEWRVTINLYRLSERHPDKDTAWCEERQEAMAYYTEDAEDALATAKAMSKQWAENDLDSTLERADQVRGPVRYMVLKLDNTTNAAFVDTGREHEVARIIQEAADKLDDWWAEGDDERHPLRDLNGNTVGYLAFTNEEEATHGRTVEGEVRFTFWCELEREAFHDDPAHEAAQYLREAAHQIVKGSTDFPIYDADGNHVGDGTIRELPSLEKEGVIDMSAALGDVYLAEGGYSGIADGEYRYVVPTNGFQPGYHQGQGDAWLVNAKGERAVGFEEPQTVRETDFRNLKAEERTALRSVIEGRVTFEDFERGFEDDEPTP